MILKTLSLFFTLFLSHEFSQQQPKYPEYSEIVKTFYSNYTTDENKPSSFIQFAKKPDGYYIKEYDIDKGEYLIKEMFWSAAKRDYVDIDFPENSEDNSKIIENILNEGFAYLFDLHPFYNYPGWYSDVIDLLTRKKKLTEDELYSLGRAYSAYTSNLINNNRGYGKTDDSFELKDMGFDQLTAKQLSKYRQYSQLSIDKYYELYQRNPEYKTIVGSIFNKYSNEYLTNFLNLRIYQNEEEAKKELKDGLYSPMLITMAKNYLGSCAPNAIVFTGGDNDTFPLLYVQSQYGYRKDVIVINTVLLNTNSYTNQLRYAKIDGIMPLKMKLSPEDYSDNKLDITYVQYREKNACLNINDAIDFLRASDTTPSLLLQGKFKYMPSKKIAIEQSNGKDIEFVLHPNYMTKSDLFQLDIIQSNINTRPIYYLYQPTLGLKEYLELHGLAYKLTNNKNDSLYNNLTFGKINAEKTYQQLMDFQFDKDMPASDLEFKVFVVQIEKSYSHLAEFYALKQKKNKCRKVIHKYLSLLPNEKNEYNYFTSIMIESAHKSGLINEANSMTREYIQNLENKDLDTLKNRDLQVNIFIINKLLSFIDDKELKNKLVILQQKYSNNI